MPKKVRELKAMVAKVGYILQPGRGKGSHTFWKHPLLPEEPLTIPGKDGDDAPLYLERKRHSTGAEKARRTGKTRKRGRRKMIYHYSMVIQWSQEDQLFLVHLPEFPWQEFHTHGRTYEEAAKNGQEVIQAFVEMLTEENKPLPEPRMLPTKPLQVA